MAGSSVEELRTFQISSLSLCSMPSRFACVRLGYASMAPSFELRLHNVYYFHHRGAHPLHIVLHILLHIAQKKMEQCFLRAKCARDGISSDKNSVQVDGWIGGGTLVCE